MHGHVHGLAARGFNPYAAVAAAKMSAVMEAAASRRKLLRVAAELGGELPADAVEMMEQWNGEGGEGAGKTSAGAASSGEARSGTYMWNAGAATAGGVDQGRTGVTISYYV